MATVGSFVVNTYMNNEHYLAGIKTATNATKTAEKQITTSMDRINANQMKKLGNSLMGGLGILSLVDTGLKMSNSLVEGFSNGTVKGFADAAKLAGNTFVEQFKSLPIAGEMLKFTTGIFDNIFGGALANEDAQKNASSQRLAKQKQAEQFDPQTALSERQVEFQKIQDRIFKKQKSKEQQDREDYAEKALAAEMYSPELMKNYDAHINFQKEMKIDAIEKNEEIKRQINAENELLKIKENYASLNRTERENEVARLKAIPLFTKKMQAEAMALYDQKKAKEQMLEIDKVQAELDKNKSSEYEAAANLSKAESNRTASATSVDTALGSIKLQGQTDFSKSQEIERAKEELQKARETANNTKQQVDLLQKVLATLGGTV